MKIGIGRLKKGFSQKDLASILGVNQQTVFCWEKNKYAPDGNTLIQMARLLGIGGEIFSEEKTEFISRTEFNQLYQELLELKSQLSKNGLIGIGNIAHANGEKIEMAIRNQ